MHYICRDITLLEKSISYKFWVTGENGFMLGQGRVSLLEAVIEHGSINKAAKALNMSYKKAWRLINAINDASENPIVVRHSGGIGGGGTTVTQEGKQLIQTYREIEKRADGYFKKESKSVGL